MVENDTAIGAEESLFQIMAPRCRGNPAPPPWASGRGRGGEGLLCPAGRHQGNPGEQERARPRLGEGESELPTSEGLVSEADVMFPRGDAH